MTVAAIALSAAQSTDARTVFTPDTKYSVDSTGWQHGREKINQPAKSERPAAKGKKGSSDQPQR
jgi:hypothetical protein